MQYTGSLEEGKKEISFETDRHIMPIEDDFLINKVFGRRRKEGKE